MLYKKKIITNFIIGTFYPPGEPILPHLLRYSEFAVKDIKFGGGLCSFRFLTPYLMLFFRLLRNSPRPWVRHTRSPALPGSL